MGVPTAAQMQVTFMGNNGVMLSSGGKKVVIDALQDHLNTFWTTLPQADLQNLINGAAPFDNINYAMATHNHPDHYSSGKVTSFLANNRQAKFIGPPQVRSSLASGPQVLNITPAFQTGSVVIEEPGLRLEVFHMEHFDQFGNDFSSVQDFTYLVTMGGVSLLHLGDVDYIDENFDNFDFLSMDIDAVVLPTFNTLLSEANKAVIIDHINPRHIIATHLRAQILSIEEANVRALYPDATIFTTALDSITLNPVPEPATFGLLCAGLTLVGVRRR
ncbi:MAG: MBL fold metallo-hydrolase [Phycisphaerales bacterium]